MPNDAKGIVLCPVDFSELSAHALRYAVEMGRCGNTPVAAVHTAWWEAPPYFTPARIAEVEAELHEAQADAGKKLRTFVDSILGPAGPGVATKAVEGLPAEGILRTAAETGAWLIVMGTHGRSGWNRWMLGSVAERVLRESPIPVLTVRKALERPIRDILCPVSDTPESRSALEMASRLGGCLNGTVTALHVNEPHARTTIRNLCDWMPAEQRSRCKTRERVRHGNAAEEILRLVSAENYDLLVIGAPRRRFFEGMVLGSTTVRVVRHSSCPVLTVGTSPSPVS